MKELSEQEDFVITKADKVVAIVIVAVKDYIKETEWQQNNKKITENFQKIQQ